MTATAKPLPPHGKRPRYMRGCRCLPCINANKRYCKQYRVRTIRQPVRIDATPIRQRLQHWVEQGYSQAQIGDAVGKKSGDISKLLHGQPTLAPRVAARILNSPGPAGTPTNARVDSTGTIRRGQALHAIGYPIYEIAEGIPMATNHLGRILYHEPATVSAAVAQGMTALYEKLRWQPGPSVRAPYLARRRSWHGPFAWDGNIDDPAAKPEISEPYKPAAKYRRDPYRRMEIEHLHDCGESATSIANKLGANEKNIRDQLGAILRDRANQTPSRHPQLETELAA